VDVVTIGLDAVGCSVATAMVDMIFVVLREGEKYNITPTPLIAGRVSMYSTVQYWAYSIV